MASRIIALMMILTMMACGGTQTTKTAATAALELRCEVRDAELWVNSRYIRELGQLSRGVKLKPGSYRVEVRHSDYHSAYFEVELSEHERRILEVSLAPRY